jgi:hypothetical protein
VVDVPCHIFASVSAVETWYQILYNQNVDISQAHIFSPCGGAGSAYSDIAQALGFFKNTGVVTKAFMPWSNSDGCHVNEYFSATLFPNNPNFTLIDCGTPSYNCTNNTSLPSERFRVGDFELLPISTYTDNNQLKRAIMNYGPIALWFKHSTLYNNQSHAFCLYGWDENGNWLLTDSHQNNTTNGLKLISSSTVDIIYEFQQHSSYEAWIIKNTASKPGVYRQSRQTTGTPLNVWYDDSPSAQCITNFTNYFQFNGTLAGTSPAKIYNTASVAIGIDGLQYLDNEIVEWSYESIAGYTNGAVSFSPSTGGSTSVSMVIPGKVKIKATIKWPNGICATLTTAIIDVMNYDIVKTHDWCINTNPPKREIQYQLNSEIPNMVLEGLVYPSSNYTTTQTNSGNTFTFTITPVPMGWGMHFTVKAPNGATIGGHTSSGYTGGCYGYRTVTDESNPKSKNLFLNSVVQIVPNPVSGVLSVNINDNDVYGVKISDIPGRTLINSTMKGQLKVDVSKLSAGVYIIQLINNRNKNIITHKFIKQ